MADSLPLSVQCFAAGAVAGPHKRDHSYQLIVSLSVIAMCCVWSGVVGVSGNGLSLLG